MGTMPSKTRTLYAVTFAVLLAGVSAEKGSSLPAGNRPSSDRVSVLSIAAGGDTCASPTAIASLPYNDMGDTSTATNDSLFLGATCTGGGAGGREGPDRIYSITVAAGNSLTIQVTPAATYDVDVYILGTCGTGSTCVSEKDTGAEGVPETLGPITLSPGTYYLYIDSIYPIEDKLGSGTYALSVTGTLGSGANNTKFYTLAPCRAVDTRDPAGPFGGPALSGGAVRTFTIAGRCSVPPTAKSISINATVIQPTSGGYLTLFPGGTATPLASTINFGAGQIKANNAIVPLGANGTLSVLAGQGGGNTVHFLLDVNGYFQ
jgi:hypothetical protein